MRDEHWELSIVVIHHKKGNPCEHATELQKIICTSLTMLERRSRTVYWYGIQKWREAAHLQRDSPEKNPTENSNFGPYYRV